MSEVVTDKEPATPPQPGTPEYNALMVSRYENQSGTSTTQDKPVKPEGVPDKFWDAEKGVVDIDGLTKSYTELEKKFSQGDKKPTEESKEGTKEGDADKEAKDIVEDAGLNWDNLSDQVRSTGTISEADIEALEKTGIPRTIVEGYIEAVTIAVEAARTNTYAYAGGGNAEAGKAVLDGALQWAAENLSEPEKEFYNQQLKTSSWQAAVDQLITRSKGSKLTSGEPQLLNGVPAGSGGGYSSRAEMVKAMSDPRYRADEGYRNQVRSKVAISNF